VEFMAALLTSETGNTAKVVKYINECRDMGITVLPPDVNASDWNFTPDGDRHPLRPGEFATSGRRRRSATSPRTTAATWKASRRASR
jgi:DNA polymerase III alpha subunit